MKTMRNVCLWLLGLGLTMNACSEDSNTQHDHIDIAQEIIDEAIKAHGGKLFEQVKMSFSFRDRNYVNIRQGGIFQYERIFTNPDDSLQTIRDVLNNDTFYREINGENVEVVDTMASKYANSVNSVIYFAILPYGLNDPAVNKEYLGKVKLKNEEYHKIKVTFNQEGGGKDFDDTFLYFFHIDTHRMDYLAYLYHTDGGGIRFREAYNQREVNGIHFSDYINFKMDTSLDFMDIDSFFEAGELEQLSLIELENISAEIQEGESNE